MASKFTPSEDELVFADESDGTIDDTIDGATAHDIAGKTTDELVFTDPVAGPSTTGMAPDDESTGGDMVGFADESRLESDIATDGYWTVLIVDDDPQVHIITKLALQRFSFMERTLRFLSAYSAKEAKAMIRAHPETAVILLDVVMETNNAGLDVAHFIREELGNQAVRLVLRTGQPGDAPEESVIFDYDINDYRTKTELTRQRLYTTILVSLRTYLHVSTIERQRSELHKLYAETLEYSTALEKTRNAAEAANQAKSDFLATVGHELRTPLTVILMKTGIMRSGRYGELTTKLLDAIDSVERGGKRLLELVSQMLELVHLEVPTESSVSSPVLVSVVCDTCMQAVADLARTGAVTLSCQIDPAVERIHTDDVRLSRILTFLLDNAIKFTEPDGQAGITVSMHPDGDAAQFMVWDTGVGIPADAFARIFEPFVQLEDPLTRRHEGAGLGLSLAKKMADQIGAELTVASTVGEGTQVTLVVPNVAA